MFVCHGEIQTCTNQTGYNSPTGVISSCSSNQTRENISRGVKSTDQSIILLDRQHLRLVVPRKSRQALSNVRCQSGRNDTRRIFSLPVEIRKHTIQNPADDASRGVSADSLQRWIHGPEFLTQSTETWPQRPVDMNANIPDNDPEVKKDSVVYTSEASIGDPVLEIIERFSSWTHLKKIVAWILRYKSNLYRLSKERRRGVTSLIQSTGTTTPITIAELSNAEFEILKYVQSGCFKEELCCLKQMDQQPT